MASLTFFKGNTYNFYTSSVSHTPSADIDVFMDRSDFSPLLPKELATLTLINSNSTQKPIDIHFSLFESYHPKLKDEDFVKEKINIGNDYYIFTKRAHFLLQILHAEKHAWVKEKDIFFLKEVYLNLTSEETSWVQEKLTLIGKKRYYDLAIGLMKIDNALLPKWFLKIQEQKKTFNIHSKSTIRLWKILIPKYTFFVFYSRIKYPIWREQGIVNVIKKYHHRKAFIKTDYTKIYHEFKNPRLYWFYTKLKFFLGINLSKQLCLCVMPLFKNQETNTIQNLIKHTNEGCFQWKGKNTIFNAGIPEYLIQ